MNAERRMPRSSYSLPRRRIVTHHADAVPEARTAGERWYVPWIAAAIAMVALIIAAVAALEIVTAVPERRAPPATPPMEELVSES